MTTIVQQSWCEGRQEGRHEGGQQKERSMIATMSKNGASPEMIAALTDLPVSRVRSLIDQLETV